MGLVLGIKLSKTLIEYYKHNMKVHVAAQTNSSSVVDGIRIHSRRYVEG